MKNAKSEFVFAFSDRKFFSNVAERAAAARRMKLDLRRKGEKGIKAEAEAAEEVLGGEPIGSPFFCVQ